MKEMLNGFTRNELLKIIWEKPCLAQIELTRNCNLQCCFCFQGCKSTNRYQELSLVQWKKIVDKLKRLGVYVLNFSGGEVFLSRNLKALLEYSKENEFKTVVNTNGTIDISECIEYIDEIVFSVHGLRDMHQSITGKDVFQKIEKNIDIANRKNVPVGVNMTLVRRNFGEILEVYDYLSVKFKIEKFSPTIAIQSATGSKILEEDRFKYDEKLFEDYFSILHKIPVEKLDLKQGLHAIYDMEKEKFLKLSVADSSNCIGGKTKLVIDYCGNVYPCNFYQTEEFFCGNILKDDIYQIWNEGQGFNIFRELALDDKIPNQCKKCIKKKKCSSGCRAWTKSYINCSDKIKKGDIYYENDIRCDIAHAFIGTGNYDKV